MYENEIIEFNDNSFNHYLNHFGDYEFENIVAYIEIDGIEIDIIDESTEEI